MKTHPFYRAFEDRYRGSRELIKERLRAYLPFIEPFKELDSEASAVDLGCGRGEWLELLLENGFKPQGVDLDEGMLESCQTLNLPAKLGEAVDTLRGMTEESVVVVSGFHIAEHISFPRLQELVKEALRVLRPAGVLILETPNAENLVVGTNNFYMDPSHERPIPHLLLSFLTEYAGFSRSKLIRLNEDRTLNLDKDLQLLDVLEGVSPDYAVIAQKSASKKILEKFDTLFSREYGLSLKSLAGPYEEGIRRRFSKLDSEVASLSDMDSELYDQLRKIEDKNQELFGTINSMASIEAMVKHEITKIENKEKVLEERVLQVRQHSERLDATAKELKELYQLQRETTSELVDLSNDKLRLEIKLEDKETKNLELQGKLKNLGAEYRDYITKTNIILRDKDNEIANIHERLQSSLDNAHQWYLKAQDFEGQLNEVTEQLNQSLSNAHNWFVDAKAQQERVEALLSSTSWKLTSPLRATMNAFSWLCKLPVRIARSLCRFLLSLLMRLILSRPGLRYRVNEWLKRFPRVRGHLRQYATRRGFIQNPNKDMLDSGEEHPVNTPSAASSTSVGEQPGNQGGPGAVQPDISELTPSARVVYYKLKLATESRNKN